LVLAQSLLPIKVSERRITSSALFDVPFYPIYFSKDSLNALIRQMCWELDINRISMNSGLARGGSVEEERGIWM
jgi:hypothetical protein